MEQPNAAPDQKKRWITRTLATIAALAFLGWGATTAVANPYLQDHWLIEQIRAYAREPALA